MPKSWGKSDAENLRFFSRISLCAVRGTEIRPDGSPSSRDRRGGPVGLTAALDLAAQGIKVVLLDCNSTVSVGSQAVCYARLSGRDILAAICKKGGLRGGGHSLVEQLVYPRSHVRLASRTLWHSVGSRLATADDPVFDPFVKFGQNGMAKCGVVDVGV